MNRAFQKKLIDKLSEMVRCSEAMNCILQEQQSALKMDDPDNLLRAINDMDECRCRLLDLDKALSDLKAKDKLSRQAIKIPEAKQLLDKANSLQEKNTDLMLSNRKLIDAKMEAVPEEIKELFSAVEESAWEQEETA